MPLESSLVTIVVLVVIIIVIVLLLRFLFAIIAIAPYDYLTTHDDINNLLLLYR